MNVKFSDLENKKILITGASRGIGRSIAKQLAAHKAIIVFNFRGDESKAFALKEELLQEGAMEVHPLKFDVTDLEQMKSEISNFNTKVGPFDGLVNNAGISKDSLLLRLKESDLQEVLQVNLTASIMLMSLCSRSMLKTASASIVNMSSIVGLMGNTAQTSYSASKAGLIGATKSVAKELAKKNIRCNAICPGFIATEMTSTLSKDVSEAYMSSIPLGRFGSPEDVANLTCFLLSSASQYITGEVIKVDGGLYI